MQARIVTLDSIPLATTYEVVPAIMRESLYTYPNDTEPVRLIFCHPSDQDIVQVVLDDE